MTVRVHLLGYLAKYSPAGQEKFRLDLEPNATIGALLEKIGFPAGLEKMILVNGQQSNPATRLGEEDEVGALHVAAGQPDRIVVVRGALEEHPDVGAGDQSPLGLGLAEVAERIAPGAVHVRRVVAVLDGHDPPAAPRELAGERHRQRRLPGVLPADHGDDPHGQSASARARSSAVLMLKKSRAGLPSRRTASSGRRPTRTARWNPIARRSPAARLAAVPPPQAGP